MTENELSEKDKTIRKLARLVKDNEQKANDKINNLQEEITRKNEEIKGLIEKIKILEKRSEDSYKNITTNNTDLNEIKTQFEKEKMVMNEYIKTLRYNIDDKNELLNKCREEMNELRYMIEEERNKNDTLINLSMIKYDKSSEIQIYKISNENSSLKTKLYNAEEKIEKILENIEKMKIEKIELDKIYKSNIELLQNELNFKNNSYKTILNDYENNMRTLHDCLQDLQKTKYFAKIFEEDFKKSEKKKNELEKELIEVKSQYEGTKIRIKANENELETCKKKLNDYENKLNEFKLSKKVFDITYYYMSSLPITGRIIMTKDQEEYYFIIENRTSSRRCTFLEIELIKDTKDQTKLYLKFLKDNNQEEYFSNEIEKLLEFFNEFRNKAVESNEINKKKEGNDKRVNAKLKDIFKI